jgi:hypothetical protein
MQTAYDGRQVVGMDLHRRRSVLVRMTEDGRRPGMASITNSPAELRAQIAPGRGSAPSTRTAPQAAAPRPRPGRPLRPARPRR